MTDDHTRQKVYKKKKPQKTFNLAPEVVDKFDKWAHDHGFTGRQASKAFEAMVNELVGQGRNEPPTDDELVEQIQQATKMLADRLKERK